MHLKCPLIRDFDSNCSIEKKRVRALGESPCTGINRASVPYNMLLHLSHYYISFALESAGRVAIESLLRSFYNNII